jgi:hypothetical protein
MKSAAAQPGQSVSKRLVVLAAGLGVVVVGIGFYMLFAGPSPTNKAPSETIRIETAKPREPAPAASKQAVEVPPPQGTLRRMDAINKSFSKK